MDRLKSRARALVVGAACAVIVFALALGAWSGPGKQGPPPMPESAPSTPSASSMPSSPAAPDETVPAVATQAGVVCPQGWLPFRNPVLRYDLCYPKDWGFTTLTTVAPLTEVPVRILEALRLLSAEAFPWVPGTRTFDAILARDVIDVELNVAQPGAREEAECAPDAARTIGATQVLWCEQNYDAVGLPSANGPIHALKVLVPLTAGTLESSADARLLVIVRSNATRMAKAGEIAWQLVASIRAF